ESRSTSASAAGEKSGSNPLSNIARRAMASSRWRSRPSSPCTPWLIVTTLPSTSVQWFQRCVSLLGGVGGALRRRRVGQAGEGLAQDFGEAAGASRAGLDPDVVGGA